MKKNLFSLIQFVVINIIVYSVLIFIGFLDIKEIKIYIFTFILGIIAIIISFFFKKK